MKPDYLAPVINNFDCAGMVNRNSFSCELYEEDGGNGGTLLDGSTVKDILAVKRRFSWTLNTIDSERYAAFNDALRQGDALNLVNVITFDPTSNLYCVGDFYVTRPAFQLSLIVDGRIRSRAGPSLILEQQGALAWFIVTPPDTLSYWVGDSFDASGFAVTLSDDNGNDSDITSECALSLQDGATLDNAGTLSVNVTYHNAHVGAFSLSVKAAEVIANGDWWTLYATGLLDIYCVGDMPPAEWADYKEQITIAIIRRGATSVYSWAFYNHTSLTKAIIPDSVTSIHSAAFLNCANLMDVDIPNSVTFIDVEAFRYCASLVSVTIPNGITRISRYAFSSCARLASVTISASVTEIGNFAFSDTALTSVTISRDCVVGEKAFPDNCVISYYEEAAP